MYNALLQSIQKKNKKKRHQGLDIIVGGIFFFVFFCYYFLVKIVVFLFFSFSISIYPSHRLHDPLRQKAHTDTFSFPFLPFSIELFSKNKNKVNLPINYFVVFSVNYF
jgi:hypothetical protein